MSIYRKSCLILEKFLTTYQTAKLYDRTDLPVRLPVWMTPDRRLPDGNGRPYRDGGFSIPTDRDGTSAARLARKNYEKAKYTT